MAHEEASWLTLALCMFAAMTRLLVFTLPQGRVYHYALHFYPSLVAFFFVLVRNELQLNVVSHWAVDTYCNMV